MICLGSNMTMRGRETERHTETDYFDGRHKWASAQKDRGIKMGQKRK